MCVVLVSIGANLFSRSQRGRLMVSSSFIVLMVLLLNFTSVRSASGSKERAEGLLLEVVEMN